MKFTHDIIKVSKDLDEIVELISDVSLSDTVLLHFFDDNKFSLVSAIGAYDDLKTGLSRMLNQVFEEGEMAGVFNIKGVKCHYFGIPIYSNAQKLIGVLSFTGQKKLNFDRKENKTLKVLLKSILFVFEKEKLFLNKRSCLNQMLEINNGFYIKIDIDSLIKDIGPNFKTSLTALKCEDKITDTIVFEQNFDIKGQFNRKETNDKIYFFTDKQDKQRYKFSFLIFEGEMIISASPVINMKYTLRNYNLVLNDFSKHDYIAEYMFLQQTSEKSLKEARAISDNLVKRNVELRQAQKEIGELSKFPSENPNPILRFSKELKVVYNNPASLNHFNNDFKIRNNGVFDEALKRKLLEALKHKSTKSIIESRNGRFFSLTIVYVEEMEYVNIYASNITSFIKRVNENNDELIRLRDEMKEQKEFYEFILDNLPADIAVFDTNHKYVYINPKGIKDEKIRSYMIGKDDFDYFKLKKLPNDKAHERRKKFSSILEGKMFINWTDEFSQKNGSREIIQRSMGPLFDDFGNVKYIIGYGTDITKRVLAEEENVRLSLVAKNTNNGVLMLNKNREVLWANAAFLNRSGYNLEEFTGMQSLKLARILKSRGDIKKITKAMDQKKVASIELLRISKQGKEYWVDLNVQPLYNEELEHSGFMMVEFDITDRKKNENTIQDLNTNLERLVQEKTAKNIELSNSLRDQEKMVTIGELAAGVAHDLNTPLGAIRSGADNIKYTLSKLFNEDFSQFSVDEINFALEFSENKKLDLYIGGLQFRKETNAFTEFLENHHLANTIRKENLSNTAMLFVKNRISTTMLDAIEFILKANNTNALLTFLYDFQIIFSFVETIQSSGERASLVVQDLRSFIKEKKNTKMGLVNLNTNIQTVLNIFNHNIKNNIDLNFEVDNQIEITGLDVRLFQLWSNLIKNSIECMEDMTGLKKLNVYSKNNSQTFSIIVENNGPVIPYDSLDKIFDKFYTTKGKRNGSGLGLSIVKNVLEEHNAKISVNSNEEWTQFKITFKKEK